MLCGTRSEFLFIAGDLCMYGYIQDAMVHPDYQSKGVGSTMMTMLLKKVSDVPGFMLGVCPSRVSVDFYEKSGFIKMSFLFQLAGLQTRGDGIPNPFM